MTHWLAAAAVLAAVAVVWLVRLWLWPYGPCSRCRGRRGRGFGSTRTAWSRCRACGGTGERLRPGARLFTRHRQ